LPYSLSHPKVVKPLRKNPRKEKSKILFEIAAYAAVAVGPAEHHANRDAFGHGKWKSTPTIQRADISALYDS
jgi:hypothetical protein